jgi:hypothetical protein
MKAPKYHTKEKLIAVKLSQLKEDFSVYPRVDVDSGHVSHIADAMRAKAHIPDLIVEDKSLIIVDGLHRQRALYKVHGDKAKKLEIRVIARTYENRRQLFLDASSLNSAHGRSMTSYDRRHALITADKLGIDAAAIATALNTTLEKLEGYRVMCATVDNTRVVTPLKTSVRHLAGTEITEQQAAALPRLGGNNQMFYVNQLITLIDTKMLDLKNEALMERLKELQQKLSGVL